MITVQWSCPTHLNQSSPPCERAHLPPRFWSAGKSICPPGWEAASMGSPLLWQLCRVFFLLSQISHRKNNQKGLWYYQESLKEATTKIPMAGSGWMLPEETAATQSSPPWSRSSWQQQQLWRAAQAGEGRKHEEEEEVERNCYVPSVSPPHTTLGLEGWQWKVERHRWWRNEVEPGKRGAGVDDALIFVFVSHYPNLL